MVIAEFEGKRIYLDGYLKAVLDQCKKDNRKDWDAFLIVDGIERGGKSCFAQAIGDYLAEGKLDLNNICFTPKDFRERILAAKKYDVIIFDEAFRGLTSRAAMSEVNKMLVGIFNEIGQKNLFVIIVIPSFFELDKYPAIHRSKMLLHIYVDPKTGDRGRFVMYDRTGKKVLYLMGKKGYNYNVWKGRFHGRFTKYYAVDEKDYRAKKLKFLAYMPEGKRLSGRELLWKIRAGMAMIMLQRYELSQKQIADALGINARLISDAIQYANDKMYRE